MSSRNLDSDLAAKLARRLLRCEGHARRHASASATDAADGDPDAEDDGRGDIDAQIRRRRQRPEDAGGGGCCCPQLALKLASRLEKSESYDSGVSVASSAFCLTAPSSTIAGGGSGSGSAAPNGDDASGCRSLPTSRRGSLEAAGREFPAMSRRELGRLRDLFAAQGAGTDRRLEPEGVGRLLERLGVPLTHLAMRTALRDLRAAGPDGRIGFRDFLALLARARTTVGATSAGHAGTAAAGDADDAEDSDLMPAWIDAQADVASVAVEEVGVREARGFFESQIAVVRAAAEGRCRRHHPRGSGGCGENDVVSKEAA